MIYSIRKQGKERWEIQRKFFNVDVIWVREKKKTRLIILLVKELEFTVTSGS